MPETTVALYDTATAAILEREGLALLKQRKQSTLATAATAHARGGGQRAVTGWSSLRGRSNPSGVHLQSGFQLLNGLVQARLDCF